uniref:Uncharacterized protein n=1 Tax=Glossina pallidipes TaxID=7398 RepID=A0A1A9ZN20_GLOPL
MYVEAQNAFFLLLQFMSSTRRCLNISLSFGRLTTVHDLLSNLTVNSSSAALIVVIVNSLCSIQLPKRILGHLFFKCALADFLFSQCLREGKYLMGQFVPHFYRKKLKNISICTRKEGLHQPVHCHGLSDIVVGHMPMLVVVSTKFLTFKDKESLKVLNFYANG